MYSFMYCSVECRSFSMNSEITFLCVVNTYMRIDRKSLQALAFPEAIAFLIIHRIHTQFPKYYQTFFTLNSVVYSTNDVFS